MTTREFYSKMFKGFRSPELVQLFLLLSLYLAGGTIFYAIVEDWPLFEAFYFSGMTITTVGIADNLPETGLGKGFTVFYVFGGLGLVLTFVQSIAQQQTRSTSLLSRIFRAEETDQNTEITV